MKAITTILTILAISGLTLNAAEGGKGKGKGKGAPMDREAMFKKKDANGDGKLSKEEFTKGAKDAAKAEEQFGKMDKDKDGSVSKEEFTAAPKKKK